VAELKDRDGIGYGEAVARFGVDLLTARTAGRELKNAAAYLELHIEQGPVLETLGLPLGAVLGTYGVERYHVRFGGQMAHAGSTPMDQRRDALGPVSKLHLAIREIARRHGGVCTIGSVKTWPGIVTAVAGRTEITLDQRNMDPAKLAAMFADAKAASERFAAEEGCTVEWSRIWNIEPILFHPELVDLCEQANIEVCGQSQRLPSGPLHDAAEVCRAGVPTVMLFVQSLRGLSHNKDEDTREDHLVLCVQALDRLADKTIAWIQARPTA
jgi:hydantoinase/carbamoylase family amidase